VNNNINCEQWNVIGYSEEKKRINVIAGMFYWVEKFQSYNVDGWNFIT